MKGDGGRLVFLDQAGFLSFCAFIAGANAVRFPMHDEQELTPRQRIMRLITGTRLSSFQLAQMIGISERQVEEHLPHIVKTISRDAGRRFLLEPSSCQACGFEFTDRTRLTRPSRCPRCRSESITSPRFGIEVRPLGSAGR